MKFNLYLDPTTWDIVVTDAYNLQRTIDSTGFVAQKIINRLKTFAEEWFLDNTIGIPYFTRVLIKQADLNDVNSIFKAAVAGVPEVAEMLSFVTTFNPQTRVYSVSFAARAVDDSIVTYNGAII